MLTRLPRGYAAGHPAERWLRHLSFIGERAVAHAEVTGPALPDISPRTSRRSPRWCGG